MNITVKTPKTTDKKCLFCGVSFVAKSKSAKFCSNNCRQDNYLTNKKQNNIKTLKNDIIGYKEAIEALLIALEFTESHEQSEFISAISNLKEKSMVAKAKLKELQ